MSGLLVFCGHCVEERLRRPQKPCIPALLIIAISAWLTAAFLYGYLRVCLDGASSISLGVMFVASSCAALVASAMYFKFTPLIKVKLRYCSFICHFLYALIGILIGVAVSATGALKYQYELTLASEADAVSLLLLEDARVSEYGCRAICRAATTSGDLLTINAYLPYECLDLLRGSQISVPNVPVSELVEVDDYSWTKGVAGRISVSSYALDNQSAPFSTVMELRSNAITLLGDTFSSDAKGVSLGLIQALACGYTRGIKDSSVYEDCKSTGLAHLIAVSGSHLVIVVSSFEILFRRIGLRACARVFSFALLTTTYLVFAGLPVSGIRSGIMAIVSSASQLSRRRNSSLSSVGACVLLFLALDPKSCSSVSLALSAGSVLGIVIFSDLLTAWLEKFGLRNKAIVESIAMTTASSLITLPYSVSLFSQFPVITIFANVVAAPFFPILCISSLLSSVLVVVCSGVAYPVIVITTCLCEIFSRLVNVLASVPYSCIPAALGSPTAIGISMLIALCLLRWWPLPSRGRNTNLLAVLLSFSMILFPVFACYVLPNCREEIVALDVGQGDAFLFRSKGRSFLVDTGADERLLLKALARNGVIDLDAVIISHGDNDHCGALSELARVVNIKTVMFADGVRNCPCEACAGLRTKAQGLRGGPSIIYLKVGDRITCGSFSLITLWPDEFASEGGNSDSLCLAGSYQSDVSGTKMAPLWSFLLTGDLEATQLEEIAADFELRDIDILKVGHHGSRDSLNPQLIDDLGPNIALIGVGEGNRYGHPHPEVLSLLRESGTHIYRTDIFGDVRLEFESDRIEVDTQCAN